MDYVKELQKKIIKQNINTKDFMPVITYEDAKKICDKLSNRLERLVSLGASQPVPKPNRQNDGWISVNDKLPDYIGDHEQYYSKNVLTTDGNNIFIMARCYVEDAEGWLWGIVNGIDDDAEVDDDYSFITHWQPIPKPPLK